MIALNLAYNQNKLYKTSDYWSRDRFKLNFSEKDLGLLSPPHFVHDFWRKTFLMLYSINWPNFIVWFLYFSRHRAICVLQLFVNQAVMSKYFKLTLFLIKLFLLTKKSRQKFKYLENEKSSWGKTESIFHNFKRVFSCQK